MENLTVHNSGFRSDTELIVTGEEYAILAGTVEQLFNSNIQYVRPITYKYYDENDELVLAPNAEQRESGKLKKLFDPIAFMGANNLIEAYVGDPGHVVMEALRKRFEIHERGIEQGKAVEMETLIKEYEERTKEVVDGK